MHWLEIAVAFGSVQVIQLVGKFPVQVAQESWQVEQNIGSAIDG